MSRTQSDASPRRDNWWGDDVDDTDDTDSGGHAVPQEGPPPDYDRDLAEWKAHSILVDSSTKLCGQTHRGAPDRGWTPHMNAEGIDEAPGHDPWATHHEKRKLELTEPAIRPPTDSVRDQRHRKRYNEETGYISGGLSTWVELEDKPRQEFMQIVEACLGHWQVSESLSDSDVDRLREKARRLKRDQETSDRDILTRLILDVLDEDG